MPQTAFSSANPGIIANVDMNPAVCKRRDYTTGLAEASLPEKMSERWKDLVLKLRDLYSQLGNHSAMESNLDQTFDTPANSKNNVYFMWDFCGRTLHQLYLIPAEVKDQNTMHKTAFKECLSRSSMCAGLILNRPPGMLSMMLQGAPHDQDYMKPFGQAIEDSARALA